MQEIFSCIFRMLTRNETENLRKCCSFLLTLFQGIKIFCDPIYAPEAFLREAANGLSNVDIIF